MTSRALRLLACQIDIPAMTGPADRDAHLARTARLVSDALTRRPADLVVLPELSSLDYSRAAFERLDSLAEPLEGPSFAVWSRVAREHGVHVVFGFARRAGGNVHISSAVAAPQSSGSSGSSAIIASSRSPACSGRPWRNALSTAIWRGAA